MHFRIAVFLALLFGGFALTGFISSILGYICLGLAVGVGVDIIRVKRGYELKLAVPIRWQRKQDTKKQIMLNKLALVAKAIMDARQITPVGEDTTVYIKQSNGLTQIYPQEIKDILIKLQSDEGVILIKSFPDWLLSHDKFTMEVFDQQIEAIRQPERNNFVVNVLNTFDKWYEAKCGK